MRILIAEDEPRIARFVEKGLKANGYASTVVEDGISALDLASSGDFDMLILDVGLPRMDGFQVLTRDLLLSKVWGYDYDGASNVVDVYVGYLRGKLGAARLEIGRASCRERV